MVSSTVNPIYTVTRLNQNLGYTYVFFYHQLKSAAKWQYNVAWYNRYTVKNLKLSCKQYDDLNGEINLSRGKQWLGAQEPDEEAIFYRQQCPVAHQGANRGMNERAACRRYR